jgi:nicotinate phosphoribosyltransferase
MSFTDEEYNELLIEQQRRSDEKLKGVCEGKYQLATFSEFGTRRRFSFDSHVILVEKLAKAQKEGRLGNSTFVGTSNVLLAKNNGVKAIGTMAHEFIMAAGQGQHELNPAYSNKFALESWVKEYGTKNGIYLTDTIGTDNCLLDFNDHYSTVFSGVRHDSGSPIVWGEKMLAHYAKHKIDPKTKTFLFSDGLNFEKATELYEIFKDKAQVAFGIGTNITNDTGVKALNIVMKLTSVNGQPVAKCSDEPLKISRLVLQY